jgi:hypothetical protein
MKRLFSLPRLSVPLLLGICSAGAPAAEPLVAPIADERRDETILLVSLEDGTVIKQLIDVDADICFKQNASSSTMCLTQGDPIIDAATNTVIGFEMIENRIELVAKND